MDSRTPNHPHAAGRPDPVVIREYTPADKADVLRLIRLNTPASFAPAEEADLDEYLEHRRDLYYVLLANGTIAGCGGINFADGGTTAKIAWDIVHPAWQGRSLGTRLLEYRIEKLESLGGIRRITVRTSRQAHRFYENGGSSCGRCAGTTGPKDSTSMPWSTRDGGDRSGRHRRSSRFERKRRTGSS